MVFRNNFNLSGKHVQDILMKTKMFNENKDFIIFWYNQLLLWYKNIVAKNRIDSVMQFN